jgi:hypothetical protein
MPSVAFIETVHAVLAEVLFDFRDDVDHIAGVPLFSDMIRTAL